MKNILDRFALLVVLLIGVFEKYCDNFENSIYIFYILVICILYHDVCIYLSRYEKMPQASLYS